MYVLKKTYPGVREILNSDLIKGRKEIGRGAFSIVYEGDTPDTVLKLTVDHVAYMFLNDGAKRCWHDEERSVFTRVTKDHGIVGEARCYNSSYNVYVFECERLNRIHGNSSIAKKGAIKRFIRSYSNSFGKVKSPMPLAQVRREAVVQMTSVDMESDIMNEAVMVLADFIRHVDDAQPDFHVGNFMQRNNGEVVMSDPVCDGTMLDRFREEERRRLNPKRLLPF